MTKTTTTNNNINNNAVLHYQFKIMDTDHLLECPKLDHTSKELSKLYWDARRLME